MALDGIGTVRQSLTKNHIMSFMNLFSVMASESLDLFHYYSVIFISHVTYNFQYLFIFSVIFNSHATENVQSALEEKRINILILQFTFKTT